jgi:hypothetical protein
MFFVYILNKKRKKNRKPPLFVVLNCNMNIMQSIILIDFSNSPPISEINKIKKTTQQVTDYSIIPDKYSLFCVLNNQNRIRMRRVSV